jgi:hypothetical protein
MRAELFATDAANSFVAAFDMPPFKAPPQIVVWGARTFSRSGGIVHTTDCKLRADAEEPAPDKCTCDGGAIDYQEAFAFTVSDMHQIEKGRDRPITRKP